MKKSIVVSLHIAYWVIYLSNLFYRYILFLEQTPDRAERNSVNVNTFTELVTSIICFYAFYLFLVPRFLANRKVKAFVMSGLAVAFVILISRFAVQGLAMEKSGMTFETRPEDFLPIVIQWILISILGLGVVLVNGLLATLMRGFISWYDEIHLKEILTSRNVQTELALVRAQINPHFLFNTLNNIDILIEKNAEAASSYLKKLSGMMRFVLYETREEKIHLTQEIEYIQKYLDLQSIRTENNDFVSFDVRMGSTDPLIAPMLFVPFIENAFKHSGNKKQKHGIVISLQLVNERKIVFNCKNIVSSDQTVPTGHSGLGIDLIKQRVQLLYGENQVMEIKHTNEYFEVLLEISIHD